MHLILCGGNDAFQSQTAFQLETAAYDKVIKIMVSNFMTGGDEKDVGDDDDRSSLESWELKVAAVLLPA